MKIAAVVILYNPPENVVANIQSYHPYVEKVFVFDNTETECKMREKIMAIPGVQFFHNHKNEGIARRLNEAVAIARQQNFDWLLTMDQDTCFSNPTIKTYLQCCSSFKQKERVAMFGTSYSSKVQHAALAFGFTEGENLITSGMLLNLAAATTLGPFDEKLFIDSVDHDYVIRAKLGGFQVIKFNHIWVQHSLGNEVHRASIKTLFLVKKKKIVHTPLRCYYMYRNMLYLYNKYKNDHSQVAKAFKKMVNGNILANVFYNRSFLQTCKYLLKAKRDFKQQRMGQIDQQLQLQVYQKAP